MTDRPGLRRRWAQGRPCHGVWSLLPGAGTADVLARTGADYVVVGVHAYGGEEAAGFAAEGATIVTVAVDAVSLREAVSDHLARGSPAVSRRRRPTGPGTTA